MADPTTRKITMAELASHGTKQDAWIALRGKVFDITSYIEQHPGGMSTISKALGKDSTELFNSVHSYVKFEEILAGKQVGELEGVHVHHKRDSILKEKDKKPSQWRPQDHHKKSTGFLGCCGTQHIEGYPVTQMYESANSIAYSVTFLDGIESQESDWTVAITDQKILTVRKVVNHCDIWLSQQQLTERLTNDTLRIHFDNNFNTMEVILTKPTSGKKWKSIGTPDGPDHNQVIDSRSTLDSFQARLVYKEPVAANIYLFGLQLKPCARFGIPIGFHVRLRIGTDTKRSYTPVCYSIMGEEEPKLGEGQVIWFLIKIYPEGILTQQLNKLPVQRPDNPEFPISMGTPGGSFEMEMLMNKDSEVLMLFAGGTGITPFTRVILWFLEKVRRAETAKQVILMYWNKTEEDMVWKNSWVDLDTREPWFHFFPFLTSLQSKESRAMLKGPATVALIRGALDSLPFHISNSENKQGMICGPTGFISTLEESLNGIIPLDNVHVFAG